jgi:hypothetical protein
LYGKKRRLENPDYDKSYIKERRLKDPLFRLKCNLRNLIGSFIRNKGFSKNDVTSEILGCTFEEFKEYLEDNPYGFTIDDSGLDLDHIIPLASLSTEDEIYEANHFSNFQLLPAEYNRNIKKDNPWNQEDFEDWLINY